MIFSFMRMKGGLDSQVSIALKEIVQLVFDHSVEYHENTLYDSCRGLDFRQRHISYHLSKERRNETYST